MMSSFLVYYLINLILPCASNYFEVIYIWPKLDQWTLREKCPYSVFFCPYFAAFELNTERYSVSLCIQFEFGKIRTRKTQNTDTFHALGTGMAAYDSEILYHDLHLVGCPFSYWISTRLKNNPSVKLFIKKLSFLRNNINFLTNSSADHADLQFQIPNL